jgi:hypothetical protein
VITTWTVGGGVEWAFAANWSIKAEYMFVGLDNDDLRSCGSATLASGATVRGGPFCFNHSFGGIHTAKVGLNFRFGPFGFNAQELRLRPVDGPPDGPAVNGPKASRQNLIRQTAIGSRCGSAFQAPV